MAQLGMSLLDLVKVHNHLLEEKERLDQQVKENKTAIKASAERIAQQMIDDECPQIATGGYVFSLTSKTTYSKRSEAELAEKGVSFLQVLRDEGLGGIIVEKVDPRTLQSTMASYVEEFGELSPELAAVVSVYEYNDISRRKESGKRGRKGGEKP